ERLKAEGVSTEQARLAAVEAESGARVALQDAQAAHARAAVEEKALVALLAVNQSDLWPPLLNALVVTSGYEGALGAALGDDLTASADAGAPIHWQELAGYDAPAALPAGAEPLTQIVHGPAARTRPPSHIP